MSMTTRITQQRARVLPVGRGTLLRGLDRRRRLQAVHLPAAVLQAPLATSGTRSTSRPSTSPAATRTYAAFARRTTASRSRMARTGGTCARRRSDVGQAIQRRCARSRPPTRSARRHLRRRAVDEQGAPARRTLKNLLEHFSTQTLSIANVPEDELGDGYEFLIKKFADDSGHTAQSSTPTAPSST